MQLRSSGSGRAFESSTDGRRRLERLIPGGDPETVGRGRDDDSGETPVVSHGRNDHESRGFSRRGFGSAARPVARASRSAPGLSAWLIGELQDLEGTMRLRRTSRRVRTASPSFRPGSRADEQQRQDWRKSSDRAFPDLQRRHDQVGTARGLQGRGRRACLSIYLQAVACQRIFLFAFQTFRTVTTKGVAIDPEEPGGAPIVNV